MFSVELNRRTTVVMNPLTPSGIDGDVSEAIE